jgi:dynamin 1-like protein
LFVPEAAFELLARQKITRLESPSLDCVEYVFDELQRIVGHVESRELQRFMALRERVVEVVNDLLHKCKIPARKMINNLIAMELAYINTNHPDFLGGGGAISKIIENMAMAQQQVQQQQQQQQLQVCRMLLLLLLLLSLDSR